MTITGWLWLGYAFAVAVVFCVGWTFSSDADRIVKPVTEGENRVFLRSATRSLPFFGAGWLMIILPALYKLPWPWPWTPVNWNAAKGLEMTIFLCAVWLFLVVKAGFAAGGMFLGVKYWRTKWRGTLWS
jgi:hypothetical protein